MATVTNVIERVRLQLRDIVSDAYAFTNTELIRYTDEGQKEIFKMHPESIITPSTTKVTATFSLTDLTAIGDTIQINDHFMTPLCDYVVKKCKETSYIHNNLPSANYNDKRFEKDVNR
jgi:hypothetical protein